MCKFVPVGKRDLLNTNMISRIIPMEDNSGCVVITHDGQHFHSEFDLTEEVDTFERVRAVIPCKGISSIYLNRDGSTQINPCAFIILKDNGSIEPVEFVTDADLKHAAFNDDYGFQGFVPTRQK